MADSPAAMRAEADRIDGESRRYATTRPIVFYAGQVRAWLLRWRAASIEASATPAGRRRSAWRWKRVGWVLLAAYVVAHLLRLPWPMPDLAVAVALLAFVRGLEQSTWANGYEARQREERRGQ